MATPSKFSKRAKDANVASSARKRDGDPFLSLPPWIRRPDDPKPAVQIIEPDQLYVIENAVPAHVCDSLVACAEEYGFAPANKNLRPKKGFAFRDSGRIALPGHQALTQRLESVILPLIADVIPHPDTGTPPSGLYDLIRLYKYERGQSFGQHYDESVSVPTGRTEYTLLVYLSGGEEQGVAGGNTVFYHPDFKSRVVASVAPVRGRVLLHRHGEACYLHEGAPVAKGTKYVMRSDVIYA